VSLTYLPAVGGLEKVMSGLAYKWSKEHEIIVFTKNKSAINDGLYPYKIIRDFSLYTLYKTVRTADIYLEANISLYTALVGLMQIKKWWVIHHLLYKTQGVLSFLKLFLTFFSKNISVSNFVANGLWGNSKVIYNFVDPSFKNLLINRKENTLLYVGRLVSDKGLDVLLQAISHLKSTGKIFNLTIVGKGPDEKYLYETALQLNILSQINFFGIVEGEQLINVLNEHKIVVVPSKWEEPFGLVAIEALACGCRVVYSNAGGLPEAAGNFSFGYNNNSILELGNSIIDAIETPITKDEQIEIEKHLSLLHIDHVSKQYIEAFQNTLNPNILV
jgi:glycosyltransferase involved in cell wall biosynthesis